MRSKTGSAAAREDFLWHVVLLILSSALFASGAMWLLQTDWDISEESSLQQVLSGGPLTLAGDGVLLQQSGGGMRVVDLAAGRAMLLQANERAAKPAASDAQDAAVSAADAAQGGDGGASPLVAGLRAAAIKEAGEQRRLLLAGTQGLLLRHDKNVWLSKPLSVDFDAATLLADADGWLAAGQGGRLAFLPEASDGVVRYEAIAGERWLHALARDGADVLWAAGRDGLWWRENGAWRQAGPVADGSGGSAAAPAAVQRLSDWFALLATKEGLYVGGANGLFARGADNQWRRVTAVSGAVHSLAASGDGVVWAAGDGLWRSAGGATGEWSAVAAPEAAPFSRVAAVGDALWLQAFDGRLWRSLNVADASPQWRLATQLDLPLQWRAREERLSASHYLALLLAAALLIVWLGYLNKSMRPIEQGARDNLDNDADDEVLDRLGIGELSATLSGMLEETQTRPPYVMALDAPWGTGKTVLLRNMRRRLQQKGFTSVWFNAWHYGGGDEMLLAFYERLEQEARPRFWSALRLDGDALGFFRALMFGCGWWWRQRELALFTFALLLFGGGALWFNWLQWDKVDVIYLWLPMLALVAGWLVSLRDWAPAGRWWLGQQRSRRHVFMRYFIRLSGALRWMHPWSRRPLLVLVDDLDRCTPQQTLQALEAINFCTSEPRAHCIFILGMDYQRVCRHLATALNQDGGDGGMREAQAYLQKIFYIVMKLPPPPYGKMSGLLQDVAVKHWLRIFPSGWRCFRKRRHGRLLKSPARIIGVNLLLGGKKMALGLWRLFVSSLHWLALSLLSVALWLLIFVPALDLDNLPSPLSSSPAKDLLEKVEEVHPYQVLALFLPAREKPLVAADGTGDAKNNDEKKNGDNPPGGIPRPNQPDPGSGQPGEIRPPVKPPTSDWADPAPAAQWEVKEEIALSPLSPHWLWSPYAVLLLSGLALLAYRRREADNNTSRQDSEAMRRSCDFWAQQLALDTPRLYKRFANEVRFLVTLHRAMYTDTPNGVDDLGAVVAAMLALHRLKVNELAEMRARCKAIGFEETAIPDNAELLAFVQRHAPLDVR